MNKPRPTSTSWIISFCMVVAVVAFGTITAQMQPQLAKPGMRQGAEPTAKRKPGAHNSPTSTVTVNTLDDQDNGACTPAHCSLREAVKYAPAGSDVVFSVTGTIVTGSEIPFNQSLNINGPGVNLISVSGNSSHRVFNIGSGNTVSISDLTITSGRTSSAPGANVLNAGSLTISRSKITSGFASFHNGGGVYNQGLSLTINDSVISNNSADSGGGGVVAATAGTTTINRCTFNDNNTGAGFGGAPGGGVYANGSSSIILNVNNCTFFNNHAFQGGGVASFAGTTNLNGVTISGNSSTFVGNGGGIRNGATLTINNSIVAGNPSDITTFAGTISGDYDLVQDGSFSSAHTINGQDPLLGPLQNNGGPTLTMALASNSPALDQGKCFGLSTDQRGFFRPSDDPGIVNAAGGDASDIGAYERVVPCAVFTTVYVDDDWAATPTGADPDGAGPATVFGCDSFATIQGGVNGVAPGGTVNVAAGTYSVTQIIINTKLTLQGAGAGVTTIDGGNFEIVSAVGSEPGTIFIHDTDASSPVKIDGFKFINPSIWDDGGGEIVSVAAAAPLAPVTISHNHFVGVATVSSDLFDNAIWMYWPQGGGVTNITDNEFEREWQPILLELPIPGAVVTGNSFHDLFASAGFPPQAMSLWAYGGLNVTAPVTLNTNTFSSFDGWSIVLRGGGAPVTSGGTENAQFLNDVTIHGNQINADGAGIVLRNPATNLDDPISGAAQSGIVGATISGNTISSITPGSSTGVWLRGPNNNTTISSNSIRGFANGLLSEPYNVAATSSGVAVHLNAITGNSTGVSNQGTSNIDGQNNWWGCNYGPGATGSGCSAATNSFVGPVTTNPWIVLGVSASPNSIGPGGTSTVTADMTHNSNAADTSGSGTVPLMPVAFSATQGTMAPPTGTITAGQATSLFTSNSLLSGTGCATVDNQLICTAVTVTVPSFTIDDVTHNEGDASTTAFTFTITKTGATALNSSVDYATVNGTATAPSDFTAITTTNFVFLPADTIKQFTVLVNGDTSIEPTEAFTVHLSNASGATIGDADGTGTITNDDTCAVFTTVYVDDDWVGMTPGTDPDGAGPATNFGCDSFATIQDGVNGVASGGQVIVRAGTYAEAVLINKPLMLLGAQAGQNANTRFAAFTPGANGPKSNPAVESVITAAATAPGSGANDTLHIMAANVTIDGFVVDGNNPSLVQTGAVVVGGINTDSRRAIQTEDAAGNPFAANSVTVKNNVIQNFAQRGVELINGAASNTAPATTGSLITLNRIRNFGLDGVVLAFNAHADITFNTVETNDFPTEAGIWVQDFLNTGTPHTINITDNNVTVGQDNFGGIWINLAYLPTININNNTVNAAAGVTSGSDFTYGVYITSLRPGSNASLNGNIVGSTGGMFDRGIALWNLGTGQTTTLTGGTVGHSTKGVSLHDNDPNFGLAGSNSAADSSGVAISGPVSGTSVGILVDASGSTGDTVAMQISGNTSVSGCTTGISVVGTNASANIHDNAASIHDNTVGIDVSGGFTITGNNLFANATGLRFSTGASGTAHFNRIISTTTAIDNPNNLTLNLENNWWGCNAGPGNTGCGAVTGTGADFNPWIVLLGSATPNSIAPGGTSVVAADMTHNSDNAVPVGTLPNIPDSYSATNGTMNPTTGTIIAGAASSLFTSTNSSNAVATITVDNQPVNVPITVSAPMFTIDDVLHNEGDVGTTAFTFTITKTGATAFSSSVDYATVNGTATAPSDFTAITTMNFVFLPADTTKQVTVLVNGDTMVEPTEAFTVHLSNPVGATISDADGLGTITNDDVCSFSLSSNSQNFGAAGGVNSVDVIAGTGCAWTAVSNDAFITVNSGTPGSGNGTVGYTVAANSGPARTGTMTIAGNTFTVTQDSGCTFTLSRDHQSFPGMGGPGSVNVTASDAGCAWTASTTSLFITITSGGSGTGNGAVQYTVAINPGPGIRSDTITIAGHTYTVYQGIDFLDVPTNHLFYTEIGKLAARGVTLGCTADHTLYCPNDSVLREQMSAFILRAKGEFSPPIPGSQRFTDVPNTNVFYNFIDRLAVLGITVGCNPPTNDMYCPGSAVTREQMSAFLLRGLGEFSPPTPASQRFNDVPNTNVFYNFIDRMAVLNITLGCTPDHLFYCPSDPVTRAQMAAFLVRAFDL